ncbi:MAG: type II toxin-antitoxin system RelB/DinJ family antitoxin [Atopobiaceae bacterium]|nr:type II toxin-antitoxin system RelB/DinJ family antitoxin [Atopobiaceae bacterium]MCI2172726.1 type II toxin-antitoxin system RelB/DinJ family antitoxin [Atopobiaceae bacterium]MCI2207033.1 type II toxin-antitoxin system RelB/DinJ family antitoxin [Atopobiaceae bacterium]
MADKMTPVVAKVLPSEKERFYDATSRIGTTPSNAIRMFISAFNRAGTFPFEMTAPGEDEGPRLP